MTDEISLKLKRHRRARPFVLSSSVKDLKKEIGVELPTDEVIKLISLSGGIASLTFIKLVADAEPIEELTASTLRIGEKQFQYLETLAKSKKLGKVRFFTSNMQANLDTRNAKYNYLSRFENTCKKYNWNVLVVNNHSKIILMRTKSGHYVLETSSNLNENPKIEQYSFENNKELYDFYYGFFDKLEERVTANG